MCIGTPMRVVDMQDGFAWCEGRGERLHLDMRLVGTLPQDAWVLAFHGTARRAMTPQEAQQTNAALDALEAALLGKPDLGAYFADLVGEPPQLPDHLKKSETR